MKPVISTLKPLFKYNITFEMETIENRETYLESTIYELPLVTLFHFHIMVKSFIFILKSNNQG